jgi:hypothetical protein
MPSGEPTEVVGVLRVHLEEWQAAIDHARGQNESLDLADRFRQVASAHRPSRLTAELHRTYDRITGYLDIPEDSP